MAIVEKLSYEEMAILEVIQHPLMFAEFENNIDNERQDWELTLYQREFICDFNSYVALCCGRAVGKTQSISEIILWVLINRVYGTEYIAYTVPNRVHLEPVFNLLTQKLRGNSFLKNFINPKKGINSSSFTIRLLNGTMLDCRIAGQSGTGANVVGMHTPMIMLDEAGFYPWGTWIELLPTLNTWVEGFKLMVSGVPTGLRENNVLYFADEVDDKFTKHRISAHENPRYSEDDEVRNIKQYGGKDGEDYIHLVLGRHGNPTFSVFDRRLFSIQTYPVYKTNLDGVSLKGDLSQYTSKLSLIPSLPSDSIGSLIGIDLGYTEPTAIVVFNQTTSGEFRIHCRIKLSKVSYPIQEKIIDYLDSKFRPMLIGIDEGSSGKATVHHMQSDNEYINKNYDKRVVPVNFSASIAVGLDTEGNEVSEKVKPYSVSLLQEYSNNHRIVYSSTDLELISELERMTYTKGPTGMVVYKTLTTKGGKKGEDHFTAAMLCGILAYHQANELVLLRKSRKLLAPRWL